MIGLKGEFDATKFIIASIFILAIITRAIVKVRPQKKQQVNNTRPLNFKRREHIVQIYEI